MNESEIIKLLMQQIADLKAENADLRGIIKAYASKEIKLTNDIVVNSYNGSTSHATAEHKEKEINSNIHAEQGNAIGSARGLDIDTTHIAAKEQSSIINDSENGTASIH